MAIISTIIICNPQRCQNSSRLVLFRLDLQHNADEQVQGVQQIKEMQDVQQLKEVQDVQQIKEMFRKCSK